MRMAEACCSVALKAPNSLPSAASPVTTVAPASRAYLYYTPELRAWEAPLEVRID